ncbi:hypothetical protein NESM_000768700 [Novymonas esmeraldas]|uniref:Uncharacterized protein n=1 Tax=Novymonas esmeraldas TaxID=1808958 RepID=A0AAW0EZ76_9TRYP
MPSLAQLRQHAEELLSLDLAAVLCDVEAALQSSLPVPSRGAGDASPMPVAASGAAGAVTGPLAPHLPDLERAVSACERRWRALHSVVVAARDVGRAQQRGEKQRLSDRTRHRLCWRLRRCRDHCDAVLDEEQRLHQEQLKDLSWLQTRCASACASYVGAQGAVSEEMWRCAQLHRELLRRRGPTSARPPLHEIGPASAASPAHGGGLRAAMARRLWTAYERYTKCAVPVSLCATVTPSPTCSEDKNECVCIASTYGDVLRAAEVRTERLEASAQHEEAMLHCTDAVSGDGEQRCGGADAGRPSHVAATSAIGECYRDNGTGALGGTPPRLSTSGAGVSTQRVACVHGTSGCQGVRAGSGALFSAVGRSLSVAEVDSLRVQLGALEARLAASLLLLQQSAPDRSTGGPAEPLRPPPLHQLAAGTTRARTRTPLSSLCGACDGARVTDPVGAGACTGTCPSCGRQPPAPLADTHRVVLCVGRRRHWHAHEQERTAQWDELRRLRGELKRALRSLTSWNRRECAD